MILHLFEDILHIVKRPERHTLAAQDAICRAQVEVKIRNGEFADIALTGEAESPHLCLHDNLFILLALKPLCIDALQQLDGLGYADLQLVEGFLIVLKEDVLCTADPSNEEFGCIATALNLIVETVSY